MLTTAFLGAILIWASYVDFRIKEIPDAVHIGLIVCAVVGSLLGIHVLDLKLAWAGLFVGAGLLVLISLIGPMGGGDIKLMGALGMWFGPVQIITVLLLSFIVGSVIACGYAIKYCKRRLEIPFGPAIAVAAVTVWLTGFSVFV